MNTKQKQAALDTLEKKLGHVPTPEEIIEAARHPKSPLHGEFDWDDTVAARKWRLEQARHLLSIRVVITNTVYELHVPKFVRDVRKGPKEQGYVSIAHLRTDEDHARETVLSEIMRARSHMQRALDIAVALGLGQKLSKITGMTDQLIAEMQGEVLPVTSPVNRRVDTRQKRSRTNNRKALKRAA